MTYTVCLFIISFLEPFSSWSHSHTTHTTHAHHTHHTCTHTTHTHHTHHTHTTHTCNPGEKKFECLEDLVQDGLITLYLQQHNAGLTMQRGRVVVRHKSQRQTRLKRKSARWVPSPLVVCRQCCVHVHWKQGQKNSTEQHTTPTFLFFLGSSTLA